MELASTEFDEHGKSEKFPDGSSWGEQMELIELSDNTPALKVVESNALIEANYELSVQEHKLILLALANIRKNQEAVREQVFKVQDLIEFLNLNPSNAYRDLNRISKRIMSKQLEIRSANGSWELLQWVTRSWCRRGDFGIRFSDELEPYIVGLVGHYTLYELGVVLSLSSHYAIRLYKMLKQYEQIGRRTVTIEPAYTKDKKWVPFSYLMGYDPKTYKRFSNLRQRVIDPAIEQVRRHTEFKDVEFRQIKFQRRTVALEFTFSSNLEEADLRAYPLYGELISLGLTETSIRSIISKYDDDRLARNLNYTKKAHSEIDIHNPPGFFMSALRDDYANQNLVENQDQGELIDAKTGKTITEDAIDRDHLLYSKCSNDREFMRLRQFELERGEAFSDYNDYHHYALHRQLQASR